MSARTAVIYGSVRSERQGIRAARFIARKIGARGHDVTLVDPLEYELPMLDRRYREFGPGEAPDAMQAVAGILSAADGFIVVSAEYNHSIPPALKNLLDHFQPEYQYKPSGIVTYSAGQFGGVRGVANLREILGTLGCPAIPTAFPVMRVGASLDEDGNAIDENYDKFVVRFLDEYEWYVRALKRERDRQ